jgi:hypothetical protein
MKWSSLHKRGSKCCPKVFRIDPLGLYHKTFSAVMRKASGFLSVTHFLLAVTNTLAFNVTEFVTVVKSFMITGPRGLYHKTYNGRN